MPPPRQYEAVTQQEQPATKNSVVSNEDSKSSARTLTNPPIAVHSCCNLSKTASNCSGFSAIERSSYCVRCAKVFSRIEGAGMTVGCSLYMGSEKADGGITPTFSSEYGPKTAAAFGG